MDDGREMDKEREYVILAHLLLLLTADAMPPRDYCTYYSVMVLMICCVMNNFLDFAILESIGMTSLLLAPPVDTEQVYSRR